MKHPHYTAFLERMGTVNDLLNASSVLVWDSRTMMPASGTETRGRQIAAVAEAARAQLLSDETARLVDQAEAEQQGQPADSPARGMILQAQEAIAFHRRIPARLQRRRAILKALASAKWSEAREKNDFAIVRPCLEEQVNLARQLADIIGWEGEPYDALIKLYEPGVTSSELTILFGKLRQAIGPLVQAISTAKQPAAEFLDQDYPLDRQRDFALGVVQRFGYDHARGRLDGAVHPFEVSFTRNDVRITARYERNFLPSGMFAVFHEAGHGMYEQNIDRAFTRTPFTTDLIGNYAVGGTSYGAHESQSRLWENHVGRSWDFWRLHFAELQAYFPEQLKGISEAAFYRAVNRVQPSLIRVPADELTYDFHVMLRVELGRALIDGSLKVGDAPAAWNSAMEASLGVKVPDDRRGILQDPHWLWGQFGGFCSYTIGNVMAAQLYHAATAHGEGIGDALSRGEYEPLKSWLCENIHRHGRRYTRNDLLLKATGRPLDPEPYIAYLRSKYSDLYDLPMS